MNAGRATESRRTLVQRLTPRELVLFSIAASLLLAFPVLLYILRPAYDDWKSKRDQVELSSQQLVRLTYNMTVEAEVQRQIATLSAQVYQADSDEITLSRFLREIETLANTSAVTVINTDPKPVTSERSQVYYRVRLVATGRTVDMLRFIAATTNRPEPTGVEEFSLRNSAGGDAVECTASLVTVRLRGAISQGKQP